jgi:uncharacterized membrane protein
MRTKARLLGHPIHQMLIVFPLGLLATSLIFDGVHAATGNGNWSSIAYYMIGAGIVGGLAAAVFGLIDWLSIPAGSRAKRVGAYHGLINVGVVALFGVSWLLRRDDPANAPALAYVLAVAAGGFAMVSGWLGGELVDRMGVGVDDGAHVDAPSSLTHRDLARVPVRRR